MCVRVFRLHVLLDLQSVLGSARVKALGFKYVVPVVLSSIIMLAVAMLNNFFMCCTVKRQYPAKGKIKLLCEVVPERWLSRWV